MKSPPSRSRRAARDSAMLCSFPDLEITHPRMHECTRLPGRVAEREDSLPAPHPPAAQEGPASLPPGRSWFKGTRAWPCNLRNQLTCRPRVHGPVFSFIFSLPGIGGGKAVTVGQSLDSTPSPCWQKLVQVVRPRAGRGCCPGGEGAPCWGRGVD